MNWHQWVKFDRLVVIKGKYIPNWAADVAVGGIGAFDVDVSVKKYFGAVDLVCSVWRAPTL